MSNQNKISLPFCFPGILFIYMGFSKFIGGIVSCLINFNIYRSDMEFLLKNTFTMSYVLQIMLFIGIGIFLLIRKLPIVNTILWGSMGTILFASIVNPTISYAPARLFDALFECFGYLLLCLISLGVFTNFKALSKVWFLPIILILCMKPITFITSVSNAISYGNYNPFYFVNIFSTLIKTAILAVTIILLCKWYKKAIDLLKAE